MSYLDYEGLQTFKGELDKAFSGFIVSSASGAIASFPDGAAGAVKSLVAQIEPKQSGSGDPSPTNIRPISGWTGAEGKRTGKNLFDKTTITPHSWIVVNSTELAPADSFFVSDYIPVIAGEKIFSTARGASRAAYYDKWKNPISYLSWNGGTLTPQFDGYIRITDTNDHLDTLQVEFGTKVTDYDSSQAETISVTFPDAAGTVYGGTLDVTNGVLTVDTAFYEFDGSNDENWTLADGSNIRNAFKIDGLAYGTAHTNFKSSSIKPDPSSQSEMGDVPTCRFPAFNANYFLVFMPKTMAADLAAFRAWLSNNHEQIAYKMSTSTTYQLTPQEVTTLLGANNIWFDTGDTSVEYPADTKLYIEKKVAELQALILDS